MAHVGELFAKLDIFLPEIMLSGEALTAAVDILTPYLEATGGREIKGKVVLGVVKGDLHEIGKNIVKLILETNGFVVKDPLSAVSKEHVIITKGITGPVNGWIMFVCCWKRSVLKVTG